MIPYLEHPVWHVGPLSIHAFGAAVAAALWFGLGAYGRTLERMGLDPVLGQRLGRWVLVGGIGGAHLFSVLLYFPGKLRTDPWLLLRVWEDISSFGSMLGGIAGAALFFAIRARDAGRSALAHLDAVAFVFPGALAIGRLGCALAHDHPGAVTSSPLAISLRTDAALAFMQGVHDAAGLELPAAARSLGFHDLGLYECLFLALVIVPVFAWCARRPRPAGFFLAAFAGLYLPVRFYLDTLRIADVRYLGLTPAQWVAAAVLAALPFVALPYLAVPRVRYRQLRLAITAVVILAVAWACRAGGP